jgi:hypothetical protein
VEKAIIYNNALKITAVIFVALFVFQLLLTTKPVNKENQLRKVESKIHRSTNPVFVRWRSRYIILGHTLIIPLDSSVF